MQTDERKVVLVTGVSSGFGHAIASELHVRGYRVFGTMRHPASLGAGGLHARCHGRRR